MEIGGSSSVLNTLLAGGASLTDAMVVLSRQQALDRAQLLMQVYALQAAVELQEAAALTLIQSTLGVGRHVDYFA